MLKRDRRIWEWVMRGATPPPLGWFWRRYLDATSTIVMACGPRWSRWRILGIAVGAWLMMGAALLGPLFLVLWWLMSGRRS